MEQQEQYNIGDFWKKLELFDLLDKHLALETKEIDVKMFYSKEGEDKTESSVNLHEVEGIDAEDKIINAIANGIKNEDKFFVLTIQPLNFDKRDDEELVNSLIQTRDIMNFYLNQSIWEYYTYNAQKRVNQ